jgi:hypothetical protein
VYFFYDGLLLLAANGYDNRTRLRMYITNIKFMNGSGIYYLELLRASEATLSGCICSRWHPLPRRVDIMKTGRKIVPTPFSEIRVGRRRYTEEEEEIQE